MKEGKISATCQERIPQYVPSTVIDDLEDLEPTENLTKGEIYSLVKEYIKQADRETLASVLGLLREEQWGYQEM